MQQPIYISSIGSISPLGHTPEAIWKAYQSKKHFITERSGHLVSAISRDSLKPLDKLKQSNSKYRQLDSTVLFALFAARQAIKKAGWENDHTFGINIGSSRGATGLFERYHEDFLKRNSSEPLSSPTTTLGNISSWVAHDLQTNGPEISHSITCSTALHALLNGIAWLQSGLSERFLVGGSEAPLTPFTIAQMQALKIYSKDFDSDYPCRALDTTKERNSMVLGEGASVVCLERQKRSNTQAEISGIGFATEMLKHNASLSANADCFQKSMQMALKGMDSDGIDVIITHTPGTIKGDQAELNAIQAVFGGQTPALTSNKWKLGHSLGASGLQSLELGLLMLKHQEFIPVPYLNLPEPKQIKRVMINAVGFGGNAVSIVLSN